MFDLYKLGWQRFQQLCLTICREILGQTVQSFLDSKDGGRDGAFSGTWQPRKGPAFCGEFVIQCKFTANPGRHLKLSNLGEEIQKAKRLAQRGRCDCYLLMTNAGISGSTAERVEGALREVGVTHALCLGSDWISAQLAENQRLRMLVPHVYGLGDLGQILDARAYQQAQKLLASLHDDLAKVVLTKSYGRAARALHKHGFVLLLGEPASGKTTIAAMLAMVAIDGWQAQVLKLDDPQTVVDHWNPNEKSQFFWIDDAFGATQYDSALAWGWNRRFAQVRAAMTNGARIVMTSRDYIYNRARRDLKETAFPLLKESQVVIDVHQLTIEEKRQILYNHMRLGGQPKAFRSAIKTHLEGVATNSEFVPEIARRLGDPIFTSGLKVDEWHLAQFVEKKEQFLKEVLLNLDADSKAALALILMRNGALVSPAELRSGEATALQRMGSDLGRVTVALSALKDSLVRYAVEEGQGDWRFKHPTVGEAFSAILLEDPELMGIYLHSAPIEKLILQVTCGDVGLEHAVIVPRPYFAMIRRRLSDPANTAIRRGQYYSWNDAKTRFLARRCDREFLEGYLAQSPEILESINEPGLTLGADDDVELAVRLFREGLLPEDNRKAFVDSVVEYAVDGEDGYALRDRSIRKMFRPSEWKHFAERLRLELVPNLARARRYWESNHDRRDDPEEYMDEFKSILDSLEGLFPSDPATLREVGWQRNAMDEWIAERHSEPDENESRPPRLPTQRADDPKGSQVRSIFDDVDA
jgi:energy-coupling factor transporter ATP-binding protein EcfA2